MYVNKVDEFQTQTSLKSGSIASFGLRCKAAIAQVTAAALRIHPGLGSHLPGPSNLPYPLLLS